MEGNQPRRSARRQAMNIRRSNQSGPQVVIEREMEEEKAQEVPPQNQQQDQQMNINQQPQQPRPQPNQKEQYVNPIVKNPFPHLKQRSGEMKIAPSQFLSKIPNRQTLRDFLTNKCNLYCPPLRDMNKQFVADILAEKKFLLPQSQLIRVENAPQFKGFSTKIIWNSLKGKPNADNILKYFPEFAKSVFPNKQYMMDVINTLDPGLILTTIQDMKKKKMEKEIAENPVTISKWFVEMMQSFESITMNSNSTGIGNIIKLEYPNCSICLSEMKNSDKKKYFKCMKHTGHFGCVTTYHQRNENNRYACPLRCPKQQ